MMRVERFSQSLTHTCITFAKNRLIGTDNKCFNHKKKFFCAIHEEIKHSPDHTSSISTRNTQNHILGFSNIFAISFQLSARN